MFRKKVEVQCVGKTFKQGGYDPYRAQSQYEGRLKKKGRPESKLSDRNLAEYISGLILKEHLSPVKIVTLLAEDDRGFSDVPQSPNVSALFLYTVSHKFTLTPITYKGKSKGRKIS